MCNLQDFDNYKSLNEQGKPLKNSRGYEETYSLISGLQKYIILHENMKVKVLGKGKRTNE